MLLVQVAILGLLHPQQVSVNGVEVIRRGAQIEVAHRLQNSFSASGDLLLQLPGDFRRRYQGRLDITAANGELQLLLTTSEEALVAAIVSTESPPAAPPAALQAQAILARSWLKAARRRHGQFDFCDTTHCQHFKQATPAGAAAAKKTRGLVLAWQGQPFAPAYSASCGGRTKTAVEIGWNDPSAYPYFAVDCPICQRNEPAWTRQPDADTAAQIRANPNRESTRLSIGRRLGWDALPSNNYVVEGAQIKGRGHGHGLGYCQRGGAGMALQGASPSAILQHYFPATHIISSR